MSGARILVIDDHRANLELARTILELAGHTVYEAEDAARARAFLEDERLPDLVLMDIQLPGTDGLTLTRELKADPRYRDLPVVAVTAFAMAGDAERARLAGCDDYLAKPIDPAELERVVDRHLPDEGAP